MNTLGRSWSEVRRWWLQAWRPGMLLLALLVGLAVYWGMLHDSHIKMREQVQADAQRLAGQTAQALALQMNTVVRKLDYFSQHLGWAWLQGDTATFHDAAMSAIRTLSAHTLAQIAVADAQGNVRYSTLNGNASPGESQPTVSIADREHFTVHAAANAPLFFISNPIKGRISQQWTIQFTRGLWKNDTFQGVLVLSVSAEHLAESLHAIFPDPTDIASLVKSDGTFLARSYQLAAVLGKKLPSTQPFMEQPGREEGAYTAVMKGIDDSAPEPERFYSWHRVEDYPLVILVGLGSEKALALLEEGIEDSHWHSGTGSALLLFAGLAVTGLWTQRSVRSADLQSVADALVLETSRLNTVLECFPGGVLLKDTGDRIVFANALWPQLLGLDASAVSLQGMHDSELRALMGPETAAWFPSYQSGGVSETTPSSEVATAQGRHLEIDHIDILQNERYFGAIWLVRDITERKQHELMLAELASTDALTGLPNRRSFMQSINTLYRGALRDDTITGVVMMLDIDRFKRVNDTYGHATGDIVLQYVARLIQSSIRATDIPGRYGGEEFVVLQANTSIHDGLATAERIRQSMEDSCIIADGHEIRITISIGVSQVSAARHPEAALQQADLALYHAKNTGRNRVCLSEDLSSEA